MGMAGCLGSEVDEGSGRREVDSWKDALRIRDSKVQPVSPYPLDVLGFATLAVSQLSPRAPRTSPTSQLWLPPSAFPSTSTSVDELQQRLIGLSSN